MAETMHYPASGTLAELCRTFGGDEDGFRGPLTKLERAQDSAGQKATKATYTPLPASQPYVKKKLFCSDLANPTPQPANTNILFASAEVYLNGAEARIAVYREK